MVSLIDIVRLLRTEFPELNIYPLEYPLDSPKEAILVSAESNNPALSGVFNMNVQIKVRDTHPTTAETICYQFRNYLNNKTNFLLGSVQVVMISSQNPVPLYMGKDNDSNYLYSNNFIFKMNEGGKQ